MGPVTVGTWIAFGIVTVCIVVVAWLILVFGMPRAGEDEGEEEWY